MGMVRAGVRLARKGEALAAALVLVFALVFAGGARADERRADLYLELNRCLVGNDLACLSRVGRSLAKGLEDPRERALMLARFALIDWAGGDTLGGNTGFFTAWSMARQVTGPGCYDYVETAFELDRLASEFGHRSAARFVLRGLVAEAEAWAPDPGRICSRPASEEHWLARVARRQTMLGDEAGLARSLDLAKRWGLAAPGEAPSLAPHAEQAARLLAAHGRPEDARLVCEARTFALVGAVGEEAPLGASADAQWQALSCFRQARLTPAARAAYREFAKAKASAIGLAETPQDSSQGAEEAVKRVLWEMVQDLSWDDPILYPYTPDFQAKEPRACFERPTARCLAVNGIEYVENAQSEARRRRGVDWSAGSLDGFARFLVGAGEDPVGFEARNWFVEQTDDAPVEDLSMLVGNAIRTGDLLWARTIFYAWYGHTGEAYLKGLTERRDPPKSVERALDGEDEGVAGDAWPLHVAWSIASLIADLDPAFEPEELAEFGEEAWDAGVAELRPLKDIPRIELIDADERSGTHLLNLCFRNAFGEWAADLFTRAHLPARAAEAEAMLPEAARDCAFAERSVGPLVRSAEWFFSKGEPAKARATLLEAADRLTRPHYHVYEDADPAKGGAAIAAAALGMARGIKVPAPYAPGF